MSSNNNHNDEQRKDLFYIASISREIGSDESNQITSDAPQEASTKSLAAYMDIDEDSSDDEDDFIDNAANALNDSFLYPDIADPDELKLSDLVTKLSDAYHAYPAKTRLSIPVEVNGSGSKITNVRFKSDKVILQLGE
jgi:hypothetical protein